LRLRLPVKAKFDRLAAVIAALVRMVSRGLSLSQLGGTGKEIEARKVLKETVRTGRHPEGR
jgi:hypothetical protein